jgi:hypothetical protein
MDAKCIVFEIIEPTTNLKACWIKIKIHRRRTRPEGLGKTAIFQNTFGELGGGGRP